MPLIDPVLQQVTLVSDRELAPNQFVKIGPYIVYTITGAAYEGDHFTAGFNGRYDADQGIADEDVERYSRIYFDETTGKLTKESEGTFVGVAYEPSGVGETQIKCTIHNNIADPEEETETPEEETDAPEGNDAVDGVAGEAT